MVIKYKHVADKIGVDEKNSCITGMWSKEVANTIVYFKELITTIRYKNHNLVDPFYSLFDRSISIQNSPLFEVYQDMVESIRRCKRSIDVYKI